ncbi:hypothetical protein MKEN_00771300 [Mycena kentingensis (nom. inval.)]|nr:hypothetical protein MKEN_00771300 [Mycena kentingensis (nom. inval.)]
MPSVDEPHAFQIYALLATRRPVKTDLSSSRAVEDLPCLFPSSSQMASPTKKPRLNPHIPQSPTSSVSTLIYAPESPALATPPPLRPAHKENIFVPREVLKAAFVDAVDKESPSPSPRKRKATDTPFESVINASFEGFAVLGTEDGAKREHELLLENKSLVSENKALVDDIESKAMQNDQLRLENARLDKQAAAMEVVIAHLFAKPDKSRVATSDDSINDDSAATSSSDAEDSNTVAASQGVDGDVVMAFLHAIKVVRAGAAAGSARENTLKDLLETIPQMNPAARTAALVHAHELVAAGNAEQVEEMREIADATASLARIALGILNAKAARAAKDAFLIRNLTAQCDPVLLVDAHEEKQKLVSQLEEEKKRTSILARRLEMRQSIDGMRAEEQALRESLWAHQLAHLTSGMPISSLQSASQTEQGRLHIVSQRREVFEALLQDPTFVRPYPFEDLAAFGNSRQLWGDLFFKPKPDFLFLGRQWVSGDRQMSALVFYAPTMKFCYKKNKFVQNDVRDRVGNYVEVFLPAASAILPNVSDSERDPQFSVVYAGTYYLWPSPEVRLIHGVPEDISRRSIINSMGLAIPVPTGRHTQSAERISEVYSDGIPELEIFGLRLIGYREHDI